MESTLALEKPESQPQIQIQKEQVRRLAMAQLHSRLSKVLNLDEDDAENAEGLKVLSEALGGILFRESDSDSEQEVVSGPGGTSEFENRVRVREEERKLEGGE